MLCPLRVLQSFIIYSMLHRRLSSERLACIGRALSRFHLSELILDITHLLLVNDTCICLAYTSIFFGQLSPFPMRVDDEDEVNLD